MTKADIDFEKELWDAANELRGAVSENNYKNYILPLVFLKHLSERYDIVHEELSNVVSDPKSTYYTKDQEERKYVLADPDEYRSRNTFVIPQKASSIITFISSCSALSFRYCHEAFCGITKVFRERYSSGSAKTYFRSSWSLV